MSILDRLVQWFGRTEQDKRYPLLIRSPKWNALRDKMIHDHPFCSACGGKTHLEVHHIRPVSDFPELELDPTNLIVLCMAPDRTCHLRVGHAFNFQFWVPFAREDAALQMKRVLGRRKGRTE